VTTVPLRLVPEDDDPRMFLPFARVALNGVEVEALVDSGAGRSQVIDRPGLVAHRVATPDSVGAFGVPKRSARRTVVSCRLGGLDAGDVEVDVVDGGLARQVDLVGQDVLAQFRCLYRLTEGVLMLDPEPPEQTHPVHVGANGHVHLDATWHDGSLTASALFDTGASATVVDEGFAAQHPELLTPAGSQTGVDVTGASAETRMAVMRGPSVLGVQLLDAVVGVVDLSAANRTIDRPMDLILGWTSLSQADWYVDPAGRRAACLPLRAPAQV
jgi:predicted aspartyl protease